MGINARISEAAAGNLHTASVPFLLIRGSLEEGVLDSREKQKRRPIFSSRGSSGLRVTVALTLTYQDLN